jgi:hypothetical protein
VAALVLAEEARPGWVFRPAAAGVWVAVTPWPEYGEGGAPAWSAKVVRFGGGVSRRYWLVWSGRLRRWVKNHEEGRLRRDASAWRTCALIDGFMLRHAGGRAVLTPEQQQRFVRVGVTCPA